MHVVETIEMPKKFEVSEKRFVVVKNDEVGLFEDGPEELATFTFARWSWFTEQFEEIDNAISKVVKGEVDVKLQLHVDGEWYVPVTSGFPCIDLRKFFLAKDGTIKLTRKGFAIRVNEWDRIKKIVSDMKEQNPKIAGA